MVLRTSSIVAASIILLVLTYTPAVVEGTCQCDEVCPNYEALSDAADENCWEGNSDCLTLFRKTRCNGGCLCNFVGCNCEGSEKHVNGYCERVAGTCGIEGDYVCEPLNFYPDGCGKGKPSRRLIELTDKCADFRFFTSLTAEEKKEFLGTKYCWGDDQVVNTDIFQMILAEVLLKFDGSTLSEVDINEVFTCELFNNQSINIDFSHLKLCKDKPSNKKNKKQKKI